MPITPSVVAPLPGAPNKNNLGATWPKTPHDHLKVPAPGSGTLGETDDLTLRRICHKLNIESAHTLGRGQLAEAYARLIATISEDAKKHAIEQWLIATGRLT